jgi:hypothetical protein
VAQEVVESWRPTSRRVTGAHPRGVAPGGVAIGVLDRENGFPPYVVWAALFGGVLAWASMLRPRLWATGSDLVMRNMLSTTFIPLAAIEQVAVRQVLAVRAGERRFVSPAVGKSWRQATGAERRARKEAAAPSYPVFVEERLHQLAEEARTRAGVRLMSEEQVALASGVRREWAWAEIAALVVTVLGFALALVLAR